MRLIGMGLMLGLSLWLSGCATTAQPTPADTPAPPTVRPTSREDPCREQAHKCGHRQMRQHAQKGEDREAEHRSICSRLVEPPVEQQQHCHRCQNHQRIAARFRPIGDQDRCDCE